MYRSENNGTSRAAGLNYLEKARKEYKAGERRRDVAAIVDFATNLLAQVGRNKGLRYKVAGRAATEGAVNEFEKAQERYRRALVDYKGAIASDNLKNSSWWSDSTSSASGTLRLPEFLKPQSRTPYKKGTYVPPGNIVRAIENIKTPVWYNKQ